MFTDPWKLKMSTAPPPPSFTCVSDGTAVPGVGFVTDVSGLASPVGQIVTNDGSVASESTTTDSTTDVAPAGTGGTPATASVIVAPGPSAPTAGTPIGPLPARVSSTRVGVTPTNTSATSGES